MGDATARANGDYAMGLLVSRSEAWEALRDVLAAESLAGAQRIAAGVVGEGPR